MSSMDTPSPRPRGDSDTDAATIAKELLEEIQKVSGMEIDIDEIKKEAAMEIKDHPEEILSVPVAETTDEEKVVDITEAAHEEVSRFKLFWKKKIYSRTLSCPNQLNLGFHWQLQLMLENTEGAQKNPEIQLATGNKGYTRQRKTKQKHNTICIGHHYTQS